jgi:hypothetical protein
MNKMFKHIFTLDNPLTRSVFGDMLDESVNVAEVLEILDRNNFLNLGEITEVAISKKSGVARCTKLTENIDLVSGKQIKYAKTYYRDGSWRATISRNTTAPMLIVIDEQSTANQYYLHIPYHAHQHLAGSTIGVSFGPDGDSTNSKWMQYAVKDFDTLCKLAK